MKSSIFTLFILFIVAITVSAQSPQAFKYQTVIRDANGQILPDQNVTIGIDLLQSDTSVYSETHTASTNTFGLVNLEIGRGTVTKGTFGEIVWGNPTSVSISLDITGGSDLQPMGTSELLSVPYALSSPNSLPTDVEAGDIAYFDGNAWVKAPQVFIKSNGQIGLGASEPILKLHLKEGDTPDIRLEQDESSGFAAHSWDIGANETNFFIREPGNGSALPFRVRAGAPNRALVIGGTGNVTIAATTNAGNETHKLYVNGDIGLTGMVSQTSDRRVKKEIADSQYGLAEVLQLSPKTYFYDAEKFSELEFPSEKQVGLIAQEVGEVIPEVVKQGHAVVQDQGHKLELMGVNYTQLIPVLVTAIQEQQMQIAAKNEALQQLSEEVELLKQQMASLRAFIQPTNGKVVQDDAPSSATTANGREK